MKVAETDLPGVLLIEPAIHRDARGFLAELYHEPRYAAHGLTERFVQDNLSSSVRNTLRGLHYQRTQPQGKLITALSGTIFDVVVDIRRGSPTFGRWAGMELTADSGRQLYVPPGFAHGFCVTSETALVLYKCTEVYAPEDERGIIWNDPTLAIAWPVDQPVLSPKDRAFPRLAEIGDELPRLPT